MANWSDLKAAVAEVIKTNGNNEITGQILQDTLNSIISNVGANATLAGEATPTTNPGAPDGNVFYFSTQAGTYTNFGSVKLNEGLNILRWNGTSWAVTNVMTIVQGIGDSENAVMSQKAVTEEIKKVSANNNLNPFITGNVNDIFINEKTYITDSGTIGSTNNNNYYTTNFISIDIAKSWKIVNSGYNTKYPTAAFFDGAFAALGGYKLKDADTDLVITDDLLSSYPTAKYVIYASYDKDLSGISVENNINSLAEDIVANAENITSLTNAVEQNTDDIAELSDSVNNISVSIVGNLLYGAKVTEGYYLGDGGLPSTSGGWSISPFIEVEPNREYTYKNIKASISHDFFYDKDKNYISSISYTDIEEDTISLHKCTTPENCRYIRLSFNTISPKFTNIYLVRSDDIDNAFSEKMHVINAGVSIDNIIGYIEPKMTHNLIDITKIVRDTHLGGFNSAVTNSAGWSTTPIIKVRPNTKYLLWDGGNFQRIRPALSFYAGKYYNSLGSISADEDGTFTTPDDCVYVQFSVQTYSDLLILQEVDGESIYYVPYGLEAENQNIIHSPFLGKKICVLGDSTTEGGQWMIDVAQKLGMWLYVNSIGGTFVAYTDALGGETTSMCTDTRINAIPEDTDIIVFAGGLNDWSHAGIPLGTLDGEHTHENFYGAYQLMLDKAFARCPNARFVIAELTYRHQGTANPQGATMMDYRNAVRAIAEKYSYPILPMYKNAGINAVNYTQFAREEGDPVHRNDLGNRRLGRVAIAAMLAMV